MSVKAVTEARAHWACDICRKVDVWGKTWRYFSSFSIEERCGHRVVTCSDECRKRPKAERLIAQFEADHPRNRCKQGADQ